MNFAADTSLFFDEFAVDVTVDGVVVRGIFDNAFAAAFNGMIDGSGPELRLPSSVAVARGSQVVIATRQYVVKGVEPDGTGITVLRLEEA